VRYANVHKQKPLVREEFLLIAEYPHVVKEILEMSPPEITIHRPYIDGYKKVLKKISK